MLIAHSRNERDEWHELGAHLRKVAALARGFAEVWGDGIWAELAGAWHDLGKARQGFQQHVQRDVDAHVEGGNRRERSHSAAGALHARTEMLAALGPQAGAPLGRLLEYLIAGHHAGLADWNSADGAALAPRLASEAAQQEYAEARAAWQREGLAPAALPAAAELIASARRLFAAPAAGESPLARSLALRMLFSALVDADFLDTEQHFDADRAAQRAQFPSLTDYRERLDRHMDAMAARLHGAGQAEHPVQQARAAVLAACRAKADEAPGVFSLNVPTGGGKTLSSLAFALRHAERHGLRRVIYAIPYTSIIEQTAAVFAGVFGDEALIEHHSQAEAGEGDETRATRLAAENWDAPLIVTTNVQLFESLFAVRTSRCRKLHRLAGSVIVLDEAQMLPPDFLQPILHALNALLARYRISLVLCTATQPDLQGFTSGDPRRGLRGLPSPRAIIDRPERLAEQLRRTRLHWPQDLQTPIELAELAGRVAAERSALAIVNTRRDAHELCSLLPDGALHLSAAMCGAHRAEVVTEIRRRLASGEPLRVIATQLIEAGVDVDFPVVFRALAGLDSIAQAAGRCNREGRLAEGQVHVVVRPIPKPLAQLRAAAEATRSLQALGALGPFPAPADFERYFRLLYGRLELDRHRIVEALCDRERALRFQFREAADKFRLIDDEDQATLLIPLHDILGGHQHLAPLIARLRAGDVDRWLLRAVQRYGVSLRQRELDRLFATGGAQPLACGLYLLEHQARYDRRFGLMTGDNPMDAATLVQ